MEHLKTAELAALRESLAPLVSDLEKTVNGLPETERASYDEAEQSVVDARRKAETHEGLLQVGDPPGCAAVASVLVRVRRRVR
jgi:hypothetical protein